MIFSGAMNPATITNGTITLSNAMDVLVPSAVAYYAATNTAVLTPNNPLAQSTTYTVTVAGGPTGRGGCGGQCARERFYSILCHCNA